MDYVLIFDVAESGFRNWWFSAFGLIFVAVSIFLVKNREILPFMFPGQMGPKDGIKLGVFVLVCSILWIGFTFGSSWRDYSTLRDALKEGNVDVVEGRVENFVSIPHKSEWFSVCGAAFSYSNYGVTAGFNNTNSFGRPLRAGAWVRIAYWGNSIARLEIARQDPTDGGRCRRSRLTSCRSAAKPPPSWRRDVTPEAPAAVSSAATACWAVPRTVSSVHAELYGGHRA